MISHSPSHSVNVNHLNSLQEYRYQIDRRFEISIKEKSKISNDVQTLDPESLATFKINVDEDEQIARNALKLPYEK